MSLKHKKTPLEETEAIEKATKSNRDGRFPEEIKFHLAKIFGTC